MVIIQRLVPLPPPPLEIHGQDVLDVVSKMTVAGYLQVSRSTNTQ